MSCFHPTTDEKYHIQNYQALEHHHQQQQQSQMQGHSYNMSNFKTSAEHQKQHIHHLEEPNNNINGNKNNSSASSCDDTIDFDESIQHGDVKDSIKHSSTADMMKFGKTFPSRTAGHYDDQQNMYGSGANSSDDYRMANMDDKKLNDDGSSSMNYASSDEMNPNNVSSEQGDKMGSGSEDEGEKVRKYLC